MFLFILQANAWVAILVGSFTLGLSALLAQRKEHSLDSLSFLSLPISWVKKRFNRWLFLFNGPNMIQDGYDKAKGVPYEVSSPDTRYIFVSKAAHITEIDRAPDSVLSLQAAAKQLLQPKYTMHNFNWFDQRGIDGTPLVRTLRTLLTNNVPEILPEIRMAISDLFDRTHDSHPIIDGVKASPLNLMVKEAVVYSNALAFFGPELAHNKEFLTAGTDFIENTLLIAEVLRLLPKALAPTVGKLMSRCFSGQRVLHDTLVPVAEQRLLERTQQKLGHKSVEHKDCIQWVMECSPKQKPWSAERIVHELMALWFGSVHILATTICFAIQDLCLHPEYIDILRQELESPEWSKFERTGKGLPLLDSFIKESARTTPVESMGSRRLALQPFMLSDGSKIEIGDWVCTPPRAMMRDPANYAQPLEFHGFRFVEPKHFEALGLREFQLPQPAKPSELTSVPDWQLWGTGRMACPGRFYAAAMMKTILGLFITKYDCQLSDPESPRWITWRTFNYPHPSTKVTLNPRQ